MLIGRRFFHVCSFLAVFAGAFLLFAGDAWAAASIYVSPPSGIFTVGSTFTVSLYVNTGGQYINAVEANLTFPPDKLQVVSPTTGRSMVQVWVAQPTYSNSEGTLKFQGAIPTPGIQTDAGLISTVTFRVKGIGTATLRIDDASRVLLNDGRGTDILGQKTDGIYYLTLPPPQGPVVTSRTNPDQEKWYNTNTTVLEWAAPPDIQGYSYILDQDPTGNPDEISEGIKTRVVYKNLADGTYYFHIKALRQGAWGGVTDYIIKVDNTPPAAFNINISPSNNTPNQRPIIDFSSTDSASEVDHYEFKIISLDLPLAKAGQSETPFFIEVEPPYSTKLAYGRYNVVVRAYDSAGNYYQAEKRLNIASSIFELISNDGLRIGDFTLGWPLTVILALALLYGLWRLSISAWKWHKQVDAELKIGAMKHPSILQRLAELKSKLKEYGHREKGSASFASIIFGLLTLALIFLPLLSKSQEAATSTPASSAGQSNVAIEPPVVTLFPTAISNDEILYIGGRSGATNSQVIIYLQNLESGGTMSQSVVTDKNGAWFYSFPQFLNSGHYLVWTQLKVADIMSPPSSQLNLTVAPAAIQIGGNRLSYQDFYLVLAIIFALAFLGILGFTVYHAYHFRTKSRKLAADIEEAEESIRRGFALLRRDIEAELGLIHKVKLSKELSTEERFREEKLLKDLDYVNRYTGKEIWLVEEAEKKL